MHITKGQAVKLYGSQNKLAQALGISRQAVNRWARGPIPQKHDLRIRYELRPDWRAALKLPEE